MPDHWVFSPTGLVGLSLITMIQTSPIPKLNWGLHMMMESNHHEVDAID